MSWIIVLSISALLIWHYRTLTRVGVRLILGFALIILLLASVVINGINEMESLSSQTVMIQRHPLTVSNAVLRVNNNIIKIHRSMKDIALVFDIAEIGKLARIVESLEKEAYRNFKIINDRFLGDKELVRDAEREFKEWKPIRDEVISLMHAGRYMEAAGITKGKGALHVVKIEKAMEALGDFARAKSDELLRISEQIKSRAFNTMYLLFVITLGTGIIVSIFITRSITRPIVTIKDAMLKIGEGELDRTVEIKSADEIGQLADSLNKMTANLKKITASRDELNEEVTERKRAEESLRNNESFLKSVFDGIQDGISVVDNDYNILRTNSALKQFYPEIQSGNGRKCYEIYQGRTEPCEDCPILKPFRTGTAQTNTVRLSDSGGEPKWVEITSFPIKGENGSVSAVIKNFRDITKRKKAEELTTRFGRILDNSSNEIYIFHEDSLNFVQVNSGARKNLGYTMEELERLTPVDLKPDFTPETFNRLISPLKTGAKEYLRFNTDHRRKNGSLYPVEVMLQLSDLEVPPVFVATLQDITERKLAEEALRASENQLHNITNAMPALIAYVDSELRYRFVNKTWEKWHMRPRSDAVGHHLLDVISKEVYERIKPNIIKVLSGNKTNFEGKENYQCGYVSHVKASYIPDFDENNNVKGFYVLVVDISERKRAEEELRATKQLLEKSFNSLNEAVFVVNPDSRNIIAVNPAVERLFGYSKEELIGRSTEIVHADRASYEEFLKTLFASLEQSGVYKSENMMRKRDGTIFLCDFTITEIRDESGKRTELVGVLADITERRLVEQELLKAQKLESLSLLAGGIAHDFNNILMGILGNISLAKFLNRSEKKSLKVLEEAEKAAIRARGLTNQLLTFSTGGTPLKNAAKIKDLVTEVSQFALRGSKSEAVNKLDNNLATVNIDSDQITQVINNLLINADQAIPEGGTIMIRGENITLTDSEEYPLPAGQYVIISVEDNGVGIPPNIIDRIFDPFFTTKSGGSGLGLSTSYSIIKNHGGLLKVTSRPGGGSIFHVYLPAVKKPVPRKSRDKIDTHGSGKILVMDDDELVRDVLGEMLSVLGYKSELAQDGEEAEKKYAEAMKTGEHYAAVILDLTVRGGMGGRQAIEKLKAIDPNVNAIVASGYSTDIVLEDYSRFGFSGYVTKPFELKTLSKVLSKTIRASG